MRPTPSSLEVDLEYTDDRLAMYSSANIAILLLAKGQETWITRAGYNSKDKGQDLNKRKRYNSYLFADSRAA
jgi:hypothetical protein